MGGCCVKPQAVFVGRVTKVSMQTPNSGKPYASITVEGAPENFNGKQFRTRVDVRVYRTPEDYKDLPVGSLVVANGEISARAYEYNGKHYAGLNLVGNIRVMDEDLDDAPAAPAPTRAAARPPSKPTSKPTSKPEDPEDDDVPF